MWRGNSSRWRLKPSGGCVQSFRHCKSTVALTGLLRKSVAPTSGSARRVSRDESPLKMMMGRSVSVGLAKLAGNFQAGKIGEMDVEQGGVGAMFAAVIEGGLTGLEYHRVKSLAAQKLSREWATTWLSSTTRIRLPPCSAWDHGMDYI